MRDDLQWQRHQAAKEAERSKIRSQKGAEDWQKIYARITIVFLAALFGGLYFLSQIVG